MTGILYDYFCYTMSRSSRLIVIHFFSVLFYFEMGLMYPWTQCIAEDDLELLILLLPPHKCKTQIKFVLLLGKSCRGFFSLRCKIYVKVGLGGPSVVKASVNSIAKDLGSLSGHSALLCEPLLFLVTDFSVPCQVRMLLLLLHMHTAFPPCSVHQHSHPPVFILRSS